MISPGVGAVGRFGELVLGRAGVALELGCGAGVAGLALVAVLVAVLVGLLAVAVGREPVATVEPEAGAVVVAVRAAVVPDGVEVGELEAVAVGECGRGDDGDVQAAARATIRTSGAAERDVTP